MSHARAFRQSTRRGSTRRAAAGRARLGVLVLMALGIAVTAGLVYVHGARGIAEAVTGIGWGMVAIVAAHFAQVMLSGQGWQLVAQVEHPAPVKVFIFARWVREAVGGLLPLTQLGGELVSIRILVLHGFRSGIATSTMIADLGAQLLSQILFTLLGLALLVSDGHEGPLVRWTLLAIVGSLAVLPVFMLAHRNGALRAVERFFMKLADRFPALEGVSPAGLHDSIHRIFSQPSGILRSFNAHLLSWLLGAGEIWLILHFLGAEVSIGEAIVIESLSQMIRSAAFAVPGALGVQEGGFMLLGALYGLPPPLCLATSLAKRVREVLLGVPALLAWQWLEGKRLWHATPRAD